MFALIKQVEILRKVCKTQEKPARVVTSENTYWKKRGPHRRKSWLESKTNSCSNLNPSISALAFCDPGHIP